MPIGGKRFQIEVDVEDVGPQTKISELTVEQFVKLVVQVRQQPSASSEMADPQAVAVPAERVREILDPGLSKDPSDAEIMKEAQEVQKAIADRLRRTMEAGEPG